MIVFIYTIWKHIKLKGADGSIPFKPLFAAYLPQFYVFSEIILFADRSIYNYTYRADVKAFIIVIKEDAGTVRKDKKYSSKKK